MDDRCLVSDAASDPPLHSMLTAASFWITSTWPKSVKAQVDGAQCDCGGSRESDPLRGALFTALGTDQLGASDIG